MLAKTNVFLWLMCGVSVARAAVAPRPSTPDVPPLQINNVSNITTFLSPMMEPLFSADDQELVANNLTKLIASSDSGTLTTFIYSNISDTTTVPNYYVSTNGSKINTTLDFIRSDISTSQQAVLRIYLRQGVLELQDDIVKSTNVTGAPSDGLGKPPRVEVLHSNVTMLILATAESDTVQYTIAGTNDSMRHVGPRAAGVEDVSAKLELSVMLTVHSMATTLLQAFLGPTPSVTDYEESFVNGWLLLTALRSMFDMALSSLTKGFVEPYDFPIDRDVENMLMALWAGGLGGTDGPLVDVRNALAQLGQDGGAD